MKPWQDEAGRGSAGPRMDGGRIARWGRVTGGWVAVGWLVVLLRRRWARHLERGQRSAPPGVVADDGVRLHVEVDGPADAELSVVLAHGFSARLQEFDAQRRSLRDRARLVLFDQRGHGRSGWGDPHRATVDQLGRDLGRVLDRFAPRGRVVLVAHSMGGMAVLALAAQRADLIGDRVVGVALLSTSPGRLVRTAVARPVARALWRTGALQAHLWLLWLVAPVVERAAPFRRKAGRRWLRYRLFGPEPVPARLLDAMQEMWTDASTSIAAAFYPALLRHDRGDALPVLRGIPSLVLAGADDRTIPVEHSYRIAEALGAQAQLVVVPGAGHMVNLTHADTVNAALDQLLDRVERQRTAARAPATSSPSTSRAEAGSPTGRDRSTG